jgi:hypothetical protein
MAPEGKEVTIAISLDVVFHKSTWLQGTIQANTKAELMGVYELWQSAAEEHLKTIGDRSPRGDLEANIGIHLVSASASTPLDMSVHRSVTTTEHGMTRISSKNSLMRSGDDAEVRTNYTSDDDLQYFDCEDVEKMALLHHRQSVASVLNGLGHPRTLSQPLNPLLQGGVRNIPTAEDLHALYMKGSSGFPGDGKVQPVDAASARDVAVTVVETVFVLAGFTYWKVGWCEGVIERESGWKDGQMSSNSLNICT